LYERVGSFGWLRNGRLGLASFVLFAGLLGVDKYKSSDSSVAGEGNKKWASVNKITVLC